MPNAVIYARFSCSKQREASIDDQLRVCRQWCMENGYAVVGEYCDAAISGRTDERPEFQRMISDSAARTFSAVVVYMMDRFSRDAYDAPIYKKRLRDNGVKVLSATEAIPDGPEAVLLEKVYEGLAAVESAHIAERTKRGMEGNALKCLHNGVPVFGYRPAADGTYAIYSPEAELVREAYQRHNAGEPSNSIAHDFARRGVRTATGRPASYSFVNTMLHSEKYKGVYMWGSIRREDGMPKVVDDETWDRAQKVHPRKQRKAEEWRAYPLAGRVVCSACGRGMAGSSAHGRGGKRYDYYRCMHCSQVKPVRADWLESSICSELRSMLSDDATIRHIAELVASSAAVEGVEDRLRAAKKRHRDAEAECARYARAIGQGAPYDALKPLWDDAQERRECAAAEVAQLQSVGTFDVEDFCAFLRMGQHMDDAALLDAFVDQCVIFEDSVVVKLNYSETDSETEKEPAQVILERVREISDWLPRGAGMRTAFALVDGAVVVRLARAA